MRRENGKKGGGDGVESRGGRRIEKRGKKGLKKEKY